MDLEFKFEKFEEYYGDIKQVKQQIDDCQLCGAKLILSHLSDYKHLTIQETARCNECGSGSRKVIHIIN